MSREAFELEAAKIGYLLDRHPINDDRYLFSETNDAYRIWQAALESQAAQSQVPEGYVLVPADELSRITLDHKRYRWIRDGGWLLIGEDRGNGAEWPPADIVDLKVDKHISKAMLTASQERNQ